MSRAGRSPALRTHAESAGGDPRSRDSRVRSGKNRAHALLLARFVAQNAPMKMAIYMVGALALIVIGSLAWSTSLLGAH
jgi:hypothetical protein